MLFLYACATLQFIRYYCFSTLLLIRMPLYLAGQEKLPFQYRILPILFIRPIVHSQWIAHHLVHSDGIFTADKGAFYVISFVALVIAGIYQQKLYDLLTANGSLRAVVYPIFLFAVMWTYSIHIEHNYSYPYDMLSLAFFTAGLYYIYARRFTGLFLVILIGTFNRETTLFLIGVYMLDAASTTVDAHLKSRRFDLTLIPWARVALLTAIWIAIKFALARAFAHNDSSENYLRIHENFTRLNVRLLPAILNICGYTLPVVLLFFRSLKPRRFASYLFILPIWFAVMFCTGVIVETRIYGELCSLSAVSLVLIMEEHARRATPSTAAATSINQSAFVSR